jgi:hypothetical protein
MALAETQTTRSGPETVIPTWSACGVQVQIHTKERRDVARSRRVERVIKNVPAFRSSPHHGSC